MRILKVKEWIKEKDFLDTKSALNEINKTIRAVSANTYVDHRTGQIYLKYNPLNVNEDFFIPAR